MFYGIYLSAEGAQAQSNRMEVLSNNLANVDTIGFKRDLALMQARHAEEIEQGLAFSGSGALSDLGGGIAFRGTQTDFSSGPLQQTSQKSDVALKGDGFFMVRKQDGDYLTRAGNFNVLQNGELMTQEGYSVLDGAGTPIVINPEADYQINSAGQILQGGNPVAEIGVVTPVSLQELQKEGDNLFSFQNPPLIIPVENREVMQGYIERSGVQPTMEMMELIQTSRIYEANINMIKNQDQIISGLLSRVLKV